MVKFKYGICERCQKKVGTHTEQRNEEKSVLVCKICCLCVIVPRDEPEDDPPGPVAPGGKSMPIPADGNLALSCPPCHVCGTITVPTGTCFSCPACGASEGCG